MSDVDNFTTVEILGLTAVGESESLGEKGMQQTLNSVMNRVAADLAWMGGNDPRQVCLQPGQYDCWIEGSDDRQRIVTIGQQNQLYGPYVAALALAEAALAGNLADITGGAVSYVDGSARADVHPGSVPCLVVGERTFYDLVAVA